MIYKKHIIKHKLHYKTQIINYKTTKNMNSLNSMSNCNCYWQQLLRSECNITLY